MAWTKIQNTDEVKQGDNLRFTYITTGMTWLTAAQLAIIEGRLANKGFKVINEETANNKIIIECTFEPAISTDPKVQKASIVSGAVVIAAASAIASLVLWLLIDKIEKWTIETGATIKDTIQSATSTPAGQAFLTGGGVFIAGLGIAILYWIFKRK